MDVAPPQVGSTAVIEVEGLRKSFLRPRGSVHFALDGLDLTVRAGEIHGFLGDNGSGKTTTLRALLGLVRADEGRMRIFGRPVPHFLPEVVGRVGAIVESPRFFGNFSGRKTLRLLAISAGVPVHRVDEVLHQVGLTGRGDDAVRSYSLGMRQRLAVATALLKNPELLILDEPANGLDPGGMRQMRDLLRDLAATGTTVLISSHILAEIEMICDHVTIISAGRRVATGRVDEVLAGFDQGSYRVRVAEPDLAAPLLTAAGLEVVTHEDQLVVTGAADPELISRLLGEQGHWVRELTPLTPDLESVFLALTRPELLDQAGPEGYDAPAPQPAVTIDLGERAAHAAGSDQ
ncbi:ATP-binding cassette domain-containing protein [Melissospora conviva]|uniref:ABC transporter ATP-binding protein n=1 Tax=Melissospora conviva TaxID=3388432 RepID=UPI003B7C46ED